ncbi:MAG: DUF3604 domain-containing protein, partial [Gemmatimonadota bacterium]
SFVTLLAYEWHSIAFGDHNVYYPGDGEIVERGTLERLDEALEGSGALVIPHHIGYGPGQRGIDWDHFDAHRSPVVEIFSGHGSSERDGGPYPMYHTMGPRSHRGTVAHGLALGKRFGFVAGTDHHGGYPGHYGEGRTAVYAQELTRASLWEALRARRCYAVTGDKIELEFFVDDAFMGEETAGSGRREVRLGIRGSDVLDRIVVVKNNRPLRRVFGPAPGEKLPDPLQAKVRLEWGWGDKNELVRWDGEARLSVGEILSVEPCFSGEPVLAPDDAHEAPTDESPIHGLTAQDERSVRWFSHTRGNPHPFLRGTSALVLELSAPQRTELELELNGRQYRFRLEDLLEGSRSVFLRGWRSEALLVHRAVPAYRYNLELAFEDPEPEQEVDVYTLRVAQENDQWAWASPIWVAS